jgi:mono/diheme cytochrome c family protein
MHPEIRQKGPGTCPICKMALEAAGADPHAAAHGSGGHMQEMAATRDKLRAELADAYDQPVPGLEAADATRGKAVYDQACASCHGASGKGDGPAATGLNPPPADFTDAFHARYYSDAGRVRIIEKGSPGTAMMGFEGQLDRGQILDVYAHVATLRGGPKPAGEPEPSKHH